jgi:L-ascorbate metabolism protein UlaG (beta-lactamase superfamily)
VIEPLLADDAFLADVASAGGDSLHLWWVGQSGFLVKHRGRHLLFDPYLSDSLTRKYADTDLPHVRMTRRVVDPERLDFVEVVTSSHAHTDHLDGETLRALGGATLVCPAAIAAPASERAGREPVALTDGEQVEVAGFGLELVPAAHEEPTDEAKGFLVTAGPFRIYHSGDTVWYDAIVERLAPVEIDVALLPINGRIAEERIVGNLDGPEAARLAHAIGVRLAVPMHYELFELNTRPPGAFVAEAERLGQPYRVLRAGERLTLDA